MSMDERIRRLKAEFRVTRDAEVGFALAAELRRSGDRNGAALVEVESIVAQYVAEVNDLEEAAKHCEKGQRGVRSLYRAALNLRGTDSALQDSVNRIYRDELSRIHNDAMIRLRALDKRIRRSKRSDFDSLAEWASRFRRRTPIRSFRRPSPRLRHSTRT